MNVRRIGSVGGKWSLGTSALVGAAAALGLLAGCSSTGGGGEADGSIRGELHIYRIDYLDGHSERQFYLADEVTQKEQHLNFANAPELQPWTKLKVWGTETTSGIDVERFQEVTDAVADDVSETSQALSAPTKKTATVGFVLMDVGNGVNLSATDANTAIFGTRTATSAGLNQFYNENSYGGFDFTGDILGPETVTTLGTCQQSAITAIEDGWPTVFNKTYNHWMQYLGSSYMSCGWGGIGGEGTAARPASGSWYNASTSCTVLNQEVGHNLGLMHSNSITCTGAPFADDPQTCAGAEYGDRHTVMGSGCAHFGAYEKWYEGYFGGCNGVRATASGTYTLLPTELPCDGVQALQIPMPKTRPFHNTTGTATVVNLNDYYLELRTKVGIDAKEPAPAVLVTVGGDVPASNKTSEFTWVLDMNPATANVAEGLTAGGSFTDPAGGVTFTVMDIDATHATVNVTVAASTGAATCMDGTAFSGPGPQSCGTTSPVGGSGGAGAGGATGTGGSGGAHSGGAGGATSGSTGGSGGVHSGGASGAGGSPIGTGTAGFGAGTAGSVGAGGSFGTGGTSGLGAAGTGATSSAGSLNAAGAAGHSTTTGSGASSSSGSSDSSGCSCRQAPAAPSRAGLASAAILLLGFALRRRKNAANSGKKSVIALGALTASLLGCSSKPDAGDASQTAINEAPADAGDCTTRAEGVTAGLAKTSTGGYAFTVTALAPSEPVQSEGAPGNTWTVSIADSSGAPVTGAVLQVSSYMPDHGHYAPTAVAIEKGAGVYEIDDLVLPMPGLYDITLGASLSSGSKESVALTLCMTTAS